MSSPHENSSPRTPSSPYVEYPSSPFKPPSSPETSPTKTPRHEQPSSPFQDPVSSPYEDLVSSPRSASDTESYRADRSRNPYTETRLVKNLFADPTDNLRRRLSSSDDERPHLRKIRNVEEEDDDDDHQPENNPSPTSSSPVLLPVLPQDASSSGSQCPHDFPRNLGSLDGNIAPLNQDLDSSSSDSDSSDNDSSDSDSSNSDSSSCVSSDSSSSAQSSSSSSGQCSVLSQNSDSSSEDDSDSDSSADEGNQQASVLKVFQNGNLSLDEGVLSLMNLFMNKKLEKSLMGDILKTVLKFLPTNHNMPKTQHLLFKYVKDLCPLPPPKLHFYCEKCLFYIGEKEASCELCNSACNKFIQLPIAYQNKNLFELHNLADVIDQFDEDRNKNSAPGLYSDICDGSQFQRAWGGGKYDLVLHGYTDGVALSKSSEVKFWPLEFMICQIPFRLRFRFIITCGIWVDTLKPLLNTFFLPSTEELKELHVNGVKLWTHPKSKEEFTSHVSASGFCGDAPVRADAQNISNHGGRRCCNMCEQKMISCTCEGTNEKKRVFHMKEAGSRLRTAARMETQGEKTRELKEKAARSKNVKPCKGVKGSSVLSQIPSCDRSKVVYPEYMHIVLGIVKQMLNLWFKTNANDEWSLKAHEDDISALLRAIKVPDRMRVSRSLDLFPKWKASECRSYLLFYSMIVLSPFMKEKYIQHWLLFVSAMSILLQESVFESEIVKAETILRMFLRNFASLYRPQDFSYNIHNLSHMGLSVRPYGPLWGTSAFLLESLNGDLRDCINGTRNQAMELANTLRLFQGIQALKARVDAKNVCPETLVDKGVVEFRNKVKGKNINTSMRRVLSTAGLSRYRLYYRAVIKGETYTSVIYTRQKEYNNYTVCYVTCEGKKRYGEVFFFGQSLAAEKTKMVFINAFDVDHMRTFRHIESQVVVTHIIPVKLSGRVDSIRVENLKCKVIRVGGFVCLQPNTKEGVL